MGAQSHAASSFSNAADIMQHPILEQLHEDHVHMAKIIDVVCAELLAVERGDSLDLDLFEDVLVYVTAYPDASHHPTEDVVFAQLGSVAPETRADIDALRNEHGALIASGRNLLALVRAVAEDAPVTRAALLEKGRGYIDALRTHMNKEEAGLFPLAAERLGEADWTIIGAGVEGMEDPLFGPAVSADHRRLWQRIMVHSAGDPAPSL